MWKKPVVWILGMFLWAVVAVLPAGPTWAAAKDETLPAFRLARIFTDNMVLQQEKPIRIWGWADPGAEVTVTLTQDRVLGEKAVAELAELEGADSSRRKEAPQPEAEEEGYSVSIQYVEKNPPRLATQTQRTRAGADGKWLVEFPPAKASFRPTWIIARSAQRLLVVQNLLIGEVWVCAGQSNMAWSNFNRKDREAPSADFPGLRYVAWNDSYYKPLDDVRPNIQWQVCSPETAQRFSAVPYLFGMYLHRYLKVPVGVINVARGGTLGQTWCMREELDKIDSPIIKTILRDYDAQTAMWEDPQQVERIMAEWEQACEEARKAHEQKAAQARAEGKPEPRLRLPKRPGDPRSGWSPPAGLFNATIMPIRRLGVRGVLYYQGENNNFMRWTRYEYTFPKVPVSFRRAFGDENLPFGCISQPGWGQFGLDPEVATVAEGYAIVRDIQRRALAGDPHAGMIATYPTGNSYIHPGEKLPVAEYASLWALATVYDQPVIHRAPVYKEMKRKDGKIYLFFDPDPLVKAQVKPDREPPAWLVLPVAYQGNAPLEGFIIAGADRRWYPAKARHAKLDGQWCIEVWSDLVEDPVAVRYGWANWPTGNLVGRNRLPVPTFRTDDWPIVEGENYTDEVAQRCRENIARLREQAEIEALDRKIRQMQLDLPELEAELYVRKQHSAKKLILSKIERMQKTLDEIEDPRWLGERFRKDHAELFETIAPVRRQLESLKARAEAIAEAIEEPQ